MCRAGIPCYRRRRMYRARCPGKDLSPGTPYAAARQDPPLKGLAREIDETCTGLHLSIFERENVFEPDKVRNEGRCRAIVDVFRRTDLLYLTALHDHNAVGKRQSFGLVVGDEDHRHAGLLLDALQLGAHFQTQTGVEVGQGLVEQQYLRLHHHRTGERHALLLAAGKLGRLTVGEGREADGLQAGLDLGIEFWPTHTLELQPEGDVFIDREMREQRIGLEHQADGALVGRHAGDVGAVETDMTALDRQQAGNGAHRRRLAAAGRAEQRDQLALADVEIKIPDSNGIAIGERQLFEREIGRVRHSGRTPGNVRQ